MSPWNRTVQGHLMDTEGSADDGELLRQNCAQVESREFIGQLSSVDTSESAGMGGRGDHMNL